jgi:Mce-associated membrane protein
MSDTSTSPAGGAPAALIGLVSGLSVVLLLLAVAALGIKILHHPQDRALDQARNAALAAGRQAIVNLDAISATTLDADLKRVEDGSTGSFKQLFTKSEATLRDLYPKQKTASTGTVRAAAVVKADLDTATLLIASDRSVTDVTTKTPSLQTSRWELVLERHGGQWLLADLEPVP